MRKVLIAIWLVLGVTPALAAGDTCTGKVRWYIEKTGEGLLDKGGRLLEFGECGYTTDLNVAQQILKVCPLGSRCHVEGTSDNIEEVGIEKLIKVKKAR